MKKKTNTIFKTLIIFLLIIEANFTFGQSFFNGNISEVKIEKLSTPEIKQIRAEMEKNSISFDAMEKILIAKGMKPDDFQNLKKRIEIEVPKANITSESSIVSDPITLEEELKNNPKEFNSKIFGAEIFNNPSLTFEPNSNMATPLSYVLGAGDELQIVIYGIQEFVSTSSVSKDGKISIPNVGQINVVGMTFEAATNLIKTSCGRVFSTLKTGQSNISVTLSKIRTIKVTIIGGKKSGNYSLSSLSTVFNALYLAGGPNDNGSYRNIELIRGNKVIKKIDIYSFLTKGDQSDNIGLKDNDIIRIPVYDCRVSLVGEIKRPGIFELLPGENFNDLLKYCSGFTESAYTSTIKLIQNTNKEMKIVDLTKNEYVSYSPKTGDSFRVGILLNRFENRISIKGSVFRPDEYSLTDGLRVSDLIKKADGLTEDAYRNNAQLIRFKDDFTKELISINLYKVLSGDSTYDYKLKKDDQITIFSLYDFKTDFKVEIEGQIRKPGIYEYASNLSLFDLIVQAGGFTDAASKKIEISRFIKKDEVNKEQLELARIITVEIDDIQKDLAKNIILEPFDIVQIRKKPIYESQKTILLSGYLEYPGNYSISNKQERVLDLINRAGGLKTEANENGIFIKREGFIIPINYSKIVNHSKSTQNIKAQPGDELIVLKYIPAVKIYGSVALNTEISYRKRKGVMYFINSVGGISQNGWKKKITVSYPNGINKKTKHILFFNIFPEVQPGAVINIPQKPEKKARSVGEYVSAASISTSLVTMTALIINLFK